MTDVKRSAKHFIAETTNLNVGCVKRIGETLRQNSWLIPIVAVLFLFIDTAIHYVFLLQDIERPASMNLGDPLAVKREAWKLIWIGGSITFCLAAVGSIFHSSYVMLRLKVPRFASISLLVAVLVWLFVGVTLWYQRGTGFGFGMTGGSALRVLDGLQHIVIAKQVAKTLVFSSSLGFGAMIFIVASACGLIHPKDSNMVEELAERVRLFFHLMYLSVGLALSAVWMVFGVFHWAAALASAGEATNASVIADSIVLGAGSFYSLIMVITFLPTAVTLQGMIDAAFRANLRSANKLNYEEWKNSFGFSEMPLATVKTYIALGTPMISGLFTALVKSLFG